MEFLVGEIVFSPSSQSWGPGRIDSVSLIKEEVQITFPMIGIRKLSLSDYKKHFYHVSMGSTNYLERHKLFLKIAGKAYSGTKTTQKSITAIKYCKLCNQLFDGNTNKECANCGWIVCNCGACGCIFSDKIKIINISKKYDECLYENFLF